MLWLFFICNPAMADKAYLKAFEKYNRYSKQPINHIDSKHIAQLKAGEVVVTIDESRNGWRATGLITIYAPMKNVWLTTKDQCQKQQKSTYEIVIDDHGGGSEDWYGLLELPWPLKNRHWMIKTMPNMRMAVTSKNTSWERSWRLVKNGEAKVNAKRSNGLLPKHAEGAIYTPTNSGAWFTLAVSPETSILGYQVTTSIGGSVPDKLMTQFVGTTMDEMLEKMKERTRSIKGHYRNAHPILYGGDSQPIQPFK